MKIMIASDIHGSAFYCKEMLKSFENEHPDRILLLGDILYHGPRNDLPKDYAPKEVISMLNGIKEYILCVRGNCDAEVDQMVLAFPILSDSAQIFDGEVNMFLSHGHIFSPEKLPPLSKNSVFLYGHTHVQKIEWVDGILCINPGSVTLPKENNPRTYLIYENGEFTIYDLDGNAVNSIKI